MSNGRDVIDELFERLRAIEPTREAQDRVRRSAEIELAESRPRRGRGIGWALVLASGIAAATGAVRWSMRHGPVNPTPSSQAQAAPRAGGDAVEAAPTEPAAEPKIAEEAAPIGAMPAEKAPVATAPSARSENEAPSSASDLAKQVEEYRAALALRGHNDAEALARWQRMQREWPKCALGHEIDLKIVETLVHLGRVQDARAAARAFVARYPKSSRAADMRAIGEGTTTAP